MLKRRRELSMSMARKLLREVLVPMWCRKILKIPTRRNSSKNSNKRPLHLLRRRTRKKKIASLVASPGIMLQIVRRASGSKKICKYVEVDRGTSGYGNLLPTVLLVCHSPDWWLTHELILMCVLIFLCFLLIRSGDFLLTDGE
jgi:hypothetical protein